MERMSWKVQEGVVSHFSVVHWGCVLANFCKSSMYRGCTYCRYLGLEDPFTYWGKTQLLMSKTKHSS